MPEGFSFQASGTTTPSLLIKHGADIKTVQARVRHGSAVTTLRYYADRGPTPISRRAPLSAAYSEPDSTLLRTHCVPSLKIPARMYWNNAYFLR
ncbi:hypothetical protein ACW2Q0_15720 [Nocardia sp. R16R-3T]